MSKIIDGKYNKILHAAIQIIANKGLDKTSISDIVKEAGVAQGTFYLYFPSKKALIPAIAENFLQLTLEGIENKTRNENEFWKIVRGMVDVTFQLTEENKDVITICYSGLAIEHSMEKWELIYQPYYRWFEDILQRAIDRGEIISHINKSWTARLIINMIENSAERYYNSNEKTENLSAFKEETFKFLQRSLARKQNE